MTLGAPPVALRFRDGSGRHPMLGPKPHIDDLRLLADIIGVDSADAALSSLLANAVQADRKERQRRLALLVA
jgi:hypothetical protein